MKRGENLKTEPGALAGRFKKGNKLGGRKPGSVSITDSLRRNLERIAKGLDPIDKKPAAMPMRDWVGVALITKAASGDVSAIKELLNRIEGTVAEKVELTGRDGKSLEIEHSERLREAWSDLTDAFTAIESRDNKISSTD